MPTWNEQKLLLHIFIVLIISEWKEGHAGRLLLQDIDQTSERTDQHVRLNTLTHYKVKNECRMALLYGVQEDDVYSKNTKAIIIYFLFVWVCYFQ